MQTAWPQLIETETELDKVLSRTSPELVHVMAGLEGDIIVLGVGGKIGLSLAKRAADAAGVKKKITGVDKFPAPNVREDLERTGISTIVCDLIDRDAVDELPDAPNVVFMTEHCCPSALW